MTAMLDLVLDFLGEVAIRCFWRVLVGAVLGLGAAYTLLRLFGMDVNQVWPYVVGGVVGLFYGICWQGRSSY